MSMAKKKSNSPHSFTTHTSWLTYMTPSYWLLWLSISLIWLINQLPYLWQLKIGSSLGWILEKIGGKTKRTTLTNLQLCFPELTQQQRENLLRNNFKALGITLLETGLAWWGSHKKIQHLIHFHGLNHIEQALARGQGVMLCSAHLTCLEIIGRLVQTKLPLAVVYRAQKNPLLDKLAKHFRGKIYQKIIARDDLRNVIRTLKQNNILWYTPDVDAGRNNSVFVPFFGIPAASITATSRLAKLTGAAILPTFFYRRNDGSGYDFYVHPAIEHFPSDDVTADTLRINQIIEAAIRKDPAQYLWQYKRFKTRPEGEKRFYK